MPLAAHRGTVTPGPFKESWNPYLKVKHLKEVLDESKIP